MKTLLKKFLPLLVALIFMGNAKAKTIYVNLSATGNNTGTSWANAYTSLQSALDAAVSGNEIWVAAGTYKPSSAYGAIGGSRYNHFEMKNGVGIFGGFSGAETILSQRTKFGHNEPNETILSGDIGTIGVATDNCYNVIYNSNNGVNTSAILDGFTIRDGYANSTNVNNRNNGGGMCCVNASPTIRNLFFISNYASNCGGGLYFNICDLLANNIVVMSNSSGSCGGGIYVTQGVYVFTNFTIASNTASNGGGIYGNQTSTGVLTLNNSIIWDNNATNEGKQIYLYQLEFLTMNNCCYRNNALDVVGATGSSTNTNCIVSNPLFIDAASGNYGLLGNSPCVNSGKNTYNYSLIDIRGKNRINMTNIDMGAYEWYEAKRYVTTTGAGTKDGTSWANAFEGLQSALNASLAGDKIFVAKGTYKPTSAYDLTNTSRYYHFRMKNNVSIYGGFAGTEATESQRSAFSPGSLNETILSGDIGTAGDNSDNCYHVFYHPSGLNLNNSAVLDGFSIKSGNANGTSSEMQGGGMYNNTCSPTLKNINFISNLANSSGGAMHNNTSSPIITDCKFISNATTTGGGAGGAMYNSSSSNCILTNIYVGQNTATSGAGIVNMSSSPVITNAVFVGNAATASGGALFNRTSDNLTITNATFLNNSALQGGAVYSYAGSTIMNNSISWGNSATTIGNEFCLTNSANLTLNNSCYNNNTNFLSTNSSTFTATNDNINTNPRLVQIDKNVVLADNSPCINVGDNTYNALTTDLRGNTRIQNATIDMGANEWTSGVDPTGVTFYVKADATGSNVGTNWENAFTSLQSALNLAFANDQIWVAKGTYKPSSAYDLTNTARYYHFRLKNNVGIYGGFAGTETTLNQRTNFGIGGINETILSGDLGTIGDNSDNCYHVIFNPYETQYIDATAIIDGFTITDGNANGTDLVTKSGGGIYTTQSSATLQNLSFKANCASNYGGGLYNMYPYALHATNAVFVNNTANEGAGIYNRGSSIRGISAIFTNNTLTNNTAKQFGGGFSNVVGGDFTFNNCIVWGNSAGFNGNEMNLAGMTNTTLNYCCFDNSTNDVLANVFFTNSNNNISLNPLFIDASSGNVRLYGNSPCVNTGNNTDNTLLADFRGKTRIQNTTIDMGAYEWTSGVDPAVRTITWTGATNTDWNTAGNWNPASVPVLTDDVSLLNVTNDPIVNEASASPAVCGNLIIQADATLTIAAGKALTVNGVITNNSANGIVIQSNAAGTGSLIDSGTTNVGGTATVQQYLTAGRNWYVSSPVANATTSALSTATKAQSYNEASSIFVDETSGANLTVMKGYLSYSTLSNGVISFSGALNSGNKEIALTSNGTLKKGFNLVGNPYPSYINWTTSVANAANALTTIWYRTKVGSYVFHTFNANGGISSPSGVSGQIAPMQAFWVRANTGGGTLRFDNSMRSHAVGSNPLKVPAKLNSRQPIVRLQVSNGTYNDETVLYSNTNASNGFDNYDSPKMRNGSAVIPEIFTLSGNEELVINGLNAILPTDSIALGFRTGENNNFTIKATEVNNLDSDVRIILKDNLLNSEQDLTDGSTYGFSSEVSNTTARFSIVFKTNSISTEMGTNIENDNSILIYKNASNKIVIHFANEPVEQSSVSVYNALGQKIARRSLTDTTTTLSDTFTAGVYIVNVASNGKTTTRKLILK